MRILGVDPGTALLGWGVILNEDEPELVDYGALSTSADDLMPQRLRSLYEGVSGIIERLQPTSMAIEQLFFARNVTTAIAVGQARGVILLAAAQHNLPVYEYKPNEVKLTVAGYGGADKAQMQEMVRLGLGMTEVPRPDDAADGLAVALCHAMHQRFTNAYEAQVNQ